MRRVQIDGTVLQVSRWSLGTGSLHHLFSARSRLRLLNQAADAGFSHFDTSPLYGSGLAESDLGRFLIHRREGFTIATKVGLYPEGDAVRNASQLWLRRSMWRLIGNRNPARIDWMLKRAKCSLDASLKRLNTDYVDVLYLHEPDPTLIDTDAFLDWLEQEFVRGRIRAWGLAGEHVAKLDWVLSGHPLSQILQVKDSLADREGDALANAGRAPQFTYGYLSVLRRQAGPDFRVALLGRILARNPSGSIIVSTLNSDHLSQFVQAAESEACA